ncbi:VWD domain-containing protein [Agromyces sp. NPDC058110]|uniref:VWD domain-containing protein n=1 Tax=Agromyces sp. NPDC058110 TaxID=3346345 RepID=UPI0036DA24E4
MKRRVVSVLSAVVAAILVSGLASCTSTPADAPAPDPSAAPVVEPVEAGEWAPSTRTDELLLGIESSAASGGPTGQQAVDAFAATFGGDVPGATATDLPSGDGVGLTYALGLMRAHRSELTAEQAAALDAASGYPVDGESAPASLDTSPDASPDAAPAPVGAGPVTAARAEPSPRFRKPMTAAERSRLERLAGEAAADWVAYRHDFAKFTPQILYSEALVRAPGGEPGLAAASADVDAGLTTCKITIYRHGMDAKPDDAGWLSVMAHEYFHCVQASWNKSAWTYSPSWVVEGSAEFAAQDLYRTRRAHTNGMYVDWFADQSKPLSASTYGAWALYETFRQAGGDPYAAIRRMIETNSQATGAALRNGRMTDARFQLRAATASSRTADRGVSEITDPTRWNLAWPSSEPEDGPHDNHRSIEIGLGVSEYEYGTPANHAFSHGVERLTFTRGVGLATIAPTGTPVALKADGLLRSVGDGGAVTFCFDASGCRCPDESGTDAVPLDSREILIARAMIETPGMYSVNAEEWDAAQCEKRKPETAGTYGDPHIATFDGLSFDVMTRGEFVAARDARGGFEVQTRHEPVRTGTNVAAGNSAVALRVGGQRMTLTGAEFTVSAPVTVRVDGAVETRSSFPLGTAEVAFDDTSGVRRWTVTLADGSTVSIAWNAWFFVDLALTDDRAARTVGLLGTGNGDLDDDLRLPDGTSLPPDGDLEDDFAQAWWIEQDESLFDYESGRTTESYRGAASDPVAADSEERRECAAALGVRATRSEVDACAIDLMVTGIRAMIDSYRTVVDERVEHEDLVWVPVPVAPGPVEPEVPEPEVDVVDAVAGKPSRVLEGTTPDFGNDPIDSGAIAVPRGAFMLLRTSDCGVGVEIRVDVADLDDEDDGVPVALCGNRFTFNNGSGVTTDGEGYGLVGPAGDRRVELRASSSVGEADIRVEVFVDPTPALVDQATLARDRGWSGALAGVADAVVLLPQSADRQQAWDASGLEVACMNLGYGAALSKQFSALEPSCRHNPPIVVSATGPDPLPVVLFSRTPDRTAVQLSATE